MTATSDTRLQTLSWKVGGMDCAGCAATIRGAVERLPGVSDVKLSVVAETLTLALDENQTRREAIEKRVSSLGYTTAIMAAKTTPAPEPAACGCCNAQGQAEAAAATTSAPTPAPLSWKIGGMDCPSCAATIRGAVERMPGVSDVKLSVMSETLTLALDETQTKRDAIEKRVASLGFTATSLASKTQASGSGHGDGCDNADHAGHDHSLDDHGYSHDDHKHARNPATIEKPRDHAGDAGHGLPGHVHEATPDGVSWYQTNKGRLVLTTGALLGGAWTSSLVWPAIAHWAFIAACVIGIIPVARKAYAAASAGMPFTIEMLMTIAATGALFIGAAEEAALVVFLFAVGEVLEGVAADRARASIRALSDLVPKTAIVEKDGETRTIDAAALKIGQTVLVRPGDRIPADGEITDGVSGIDESPVTGESVPKTKGVGDPVFAGSVNSEAALRVRVTKAAEDNTIARIIRLVEEAQEARAPTERFIDRFSRVYMPAIVGLAVLVAIVPPLLLGGEWSVWVYRALALLLIGCPCALVISVPASIAASLSTGARQGLLMKGGVVIEAAAKTGVVAFDKTGTLTQGRPRVTEVVALGRTEREVVELAAAAETGSSHPLALAIVERAKAHAIPVRNATEAKAIAGQGVVGTLDGVAIFVGAPRHALSRSNFDDQAKAAVEQLETAGKTVAAVIADGVLAGLIAMRDEPREDAAAGIAELKAMGLRCLMLTGDNARTGAAIAGSLGMEHKAELMPEDKVAAIKALSVDASVMMIGDGINDAPALAAAGIGVAMGSGTDVALETADAAILKSRVRDVPAMIRLARATMSNIRVNIAIALGLKAVFLVTTVFGYTGLWIAILADTGATVIVTANALRLLRFNAGRAA
ncbi:MAG TPA: heavy metal translocating P-type ATPase [Bosea sp. (in: a-proteobacteria)]|jgi:Cd2+/Zn2+-exporting ATPase|uniref:P-type Zn(2+) transporter n=1 Tax=Bosea massiliensis TaxID=151419 RepID=A0ABW0P3V8_9HYPH|nr:heavy metal translocating P-type ATPase [Bosea sp. (in: a-proteobacteria)]HEV2555186.1 heavy metal translocating P-type ATPase [Bosea sp. (in: a-proteobacteria)]